MRDNVPSMIDLDALYAGVYAAPDEDQPRRALADALVARSDPYGEFIQLQLDEASAVKQKRMTDLRTAHATEWSKPLGDALVAKQVT